MKVRVEYLEILNPKGWREILRLARPDHSLKSMNAGLKGV